MDVEEKLALLGGAARYEIADARQGAQARRSRPAHAARSAAARAPRPAFGAAASAALCTGTEEIGRSGALLRVLQSSRCEQDCAYCPLRRSNDPQRAALAPEELARAFDDLHRRGRVDGLLLSSAVDGSPDASMERMLATARLLRTHHQYEGYIHVKVLPGVARAALEEAATLADRLSLNVEVPDARFLDGLQTGKRWQEDILWPLGWLAELDAAGAIRSGISSQLLVGVGARDGAAADDRTLAEGGRALRARYGLRRLHFGDFAPAPGTPLEGHAAPDPRRRARLYQWDWLADRYDFSDHELAAAFDGQGNLPLGLDPKLAVSLAGEEERLVEVNRAGYEELLRVPGIGPVSAQRIVDYRDLGRVRDLADLKALGVSVSRAAPFVLLSGHRPAEALPALARLRRQARQAGPRPVQLSLW